MKQIITIVLLIACSPSIYAEDKIPFEIRRIQAEKQRKIDEIEKQYRVALLKQKDIYIKRKDLESAKLIDSMLVKMIDSDIEQDNLSKLAKVDCNDPFVRFRDGVPTNKSGPCFKYGTVPKKYDGWMVSGVRRTDEPLTFKVKKRGVVTLIAKKENIFLSKGWIIVDEVKINNGTKFYILEKVLNEGEHSILVDTNDALGIRLLKK